VTFDTHRVLQTWLEPEFRELLTCFALKKKWSKLHKKSMDQLLSSAASAKSDDNISGCEQTGRPARLTKTPRPTDTIEKLSTEQSAAALTMFAQASERSSPARLMRRSSETAMQPSLRVWCSIWHSIGSARPARPNGASVVRGGPIPAWPPAAVGRWPRGVGRNGVGLPGCL
jgi:hypothetical protein